MTSVLAQVEPRPPIDVPDVEYSAMAPELILIGGALLLLLVVSLVRRPPPWLWPLLTVAAGGASLGASLWLWFDVRDDGPVRAVADALVVDGFTAFFMVLISSTVVLGALLGEGFLSREGVRGPEFYVLMMLSASGGIFMASANDLIVVFLGLEILSIALYVLAGFSGRRRASREAAMKYFVLGAFSSALFMYGVALVYGATGSTNLVSIAQYLASNVATSNGVLLAGMVLLLVGLGFKVAVVPFHTWTPDVYEGSPSPVTGFMAAAAKAAGFAALLRVFFSTFSTLRLDWRPVVWVIAVATLLVGSVLAVVQNDVKRMLAYSSISHAGYVLIGLQAASDRGIAGSLFYLLAYTFMVMGSFAIVTVVGRRGDTRHGLDEYRGPRLRRVPHGPGRRALHDRLPGQVLRDLCRGRVRVLRAGAHRDAVGGDRGVLLPATDRRDVQPRRARRDGRRRGTPGAPLQPRRRGGRHGRLHRRLRPGSLGHGDLRPPGVPAVLTIRP
jgi:NADH-quinone oxidoreductase subunit N